jgi:PQQ-dependent catabolism-associated CXXCW motif protein
MRPLTTVLAALGCWLALAAGPGARAGDVPEPTDYRMDEYRAPVPDTLAGARVLSTEEVAALWKAGGAVFVDVLPKPPKPKLPPGTVFRLPPRNDIPGSVWLPDVGYGALPSEMETYFRDNLASATGGDPAKTVVFYCLADCWMSWNAARRALEWGYTDVVWYPEGTDGWEFEGLPTERRKPVERPGMDE